MSWNNIALLLGALGALFGIVTWFNATISKKLEGNPMRELVDAIQDIRKDPKDSLHGLDKRVIVLEHQIALVLGHPNWSVIEQLRQEIALLKRDTKCIANGTTTPPW